MSIRSITLISIVLFFLVNAMAEAQQQVPLGKHTLTGCSISKNIDPCAIQVHGLPEIVGAFTNEISSKEKRLKMHDLYVKLVKVGKGDKAPVVGDVIFNGVKGVAIAPTNLVWKVDLGSDYLEPGETGNIDIEIGSAGNWDEIKFIFTPSSYTDAHNIALEYQHIDVFAPFNYYRNADDLPSSGVVHCGNSGMLARVVNTEDSFATITQLHGAFEFSDAETFVESVFLTEWSDEEWRWVEVGAEVSINEETGEFSIDYFSLTPGDELCLIVIYNQRPDTAILDLQAVYETD